MIARLMRLILAAMLVSSTLARFGSMAEAAQSATDTWTAPNGAFSVQWDQPWIAQRMEGELLVVANDSTVAVASSIIPLSDINPSLCVDAYVDAAASPEVKATLPFMEGKTSWRAWAAYDNLQIGVVDYFECQITPDGKSLALFAGGTTLMEKFANIPMLVDFLGQWVIPTAGETGPTVAADGWRLGVVDWLRGSLYTQLGLATAPSGSEYLIVTADLTNWQAAPAELPIASITAIAPGSSEALPVSLEDARLVAEALGEVPIDAVIALGPGETRRVVLVFLITSEAAELGVAIAENAAVLEDDGVVARLVVLPPPSALPSMQSGVIANVIDGRTLLVTLSDSGQSERVRLIGVGEPIGNAASDVLSAYIGQSVQLEGDPNHPDDNRLQRYVWVTDENGSPAMANELLIEEGLAPYGSNGETGRFDAMLATVNGLPTSAAGIGDQVPVLTVVPDAMAPAELTDSDRAYLAELMHSRDNYRMSMEYYDLYMTAPTLDEAFYGHLMAVVLGWSVFDEGIGDVVPPPRFADLHARYLAAIEPFDALAYQIEPALDQMLAGETSQQPFAEFDYDLMTSTVASARPALEQVLAEIDAVLAEARMSSESSVTQ